ncbi:JAB1/MPN/MOV34 metalloenzyme domain containing protein [Trema orientale]|uniref:JAB1/MPN/MOV34 metalloenzyme domain containing protein n=1 Tax=Trema orientale TaxID=63057 RepID=A0A2P5F9Q9_TREOI|nr:JAB1/MPN/MOV34 metalloenzyme domain containing protein [Trema orientale]
MRPSSEVINIAASAQKLDVDNRISLRYYYRIADNILKQANIFREEKNIIDLYVMLLRFSSLVSETIPRHREYRASAKSKKDNLRKGLLNALSELEKLKPEVQQKINELNRKYAYQTNGWTHHSQKDSLEWPSVKKQTLTAQDVTKMGRSTVREPIYRNPRAQQFSHASSLEERFKKLSLRPRPTDETLSRHSILGPNGLNGQWQPPISDKGIRYPSITDLSPLEILSQQPVEEEPTANKDCDRPEHERLPVESAHTQSSDDNQTSHTEDSLISFETIEAPAHVEIIRQPSPPPVLAEVQDLVPAVSPQVSELECGLDTLVTDELVRAETPLQLHISTTMMENFMKFAKSNTDKHLETCGVLAGSLKNRKFYVTALIIPKQESTSDSCQTTNEEEIFEVQDKRSLFPLGWIHTHPTQSCFMSSIDLHTHYSYQIMLPESVAIVMAPRDTTKNHGIFRLTTPGGMSVIRHCQQRGFHPHNPPADGGPLYKTCTDVYMNPNIDFDVIDLR